MARYLLITTRDPYEGGDVGADLDLARDLEAHGEDVTVFLVQNGVLPARRGARASGLDGLLARGTRVVADDFSLRERAIQPAALRAGIQAAPLDVVADALERGDRVLWL